MDSTITYKCLNCGAGLLFDAEKQSFVCEFCLSSFAEEELAGTDADEKSKKREAENAEFNEHLNEYCCSSCGAAVVMDKDTAADFCYYCHNPIVIADRVTGTLKPDKIVPFRFDKAEAKATFLRYAKKKWFVPNDYFSPEQSDKIQGVYYPFWVTDADSYSSLDATATKVRSWRSGDYRYTETSRYKIRRVGDIHFEDISTSAISTEDKAMLEGILPYSLNEHVEFKMPYLQGYIAKKRDLDRDSLSGEVRQKMSGYADTLLRSTVNGYTTVHTDAIDLNIRTSRWDYTLMPIWILTYQRKGKNFTYAMNGSTGKIYGELPISPWKLGIFSAVIAFLTGLFAFVVAQGVLI